MSYINIYASACKHILRTVDASTYTYQSHPIDFNTPYCAGCLAVLEREAAPEPEAFRRMGINHDMEDCAMTLEQMALGNQSNITTPLWNSQTEEAYAGQHGGEQHMPQYEGAYGIVYDSIEPRTPVQRSPEPDRFQERPGAAPLWTLKSSSFADENGFMGSFSPLQDDGLGNGSPPTSESSGSLISTSNDNSITRAEARARYEASRERNRIGRLLDKMSELSIASRERAGCFGNDGDGRGEPEHVVWLRQRLVQAQCWNESLGKVDEDFERRYGFDLLEVEGGLEMCFDAGFGQPQGCFKWVR